jgi:CheY-like chemotaxis protein
MTVSATHPGRVILCVDDEPTGLSVRKMFLEFQGYRVLTAENGAAALELFLSEEIDLVILDYAMPGMNGGLVAEKMKALKPTVPLLLLSAYIDLPAETLAHVAKYVTKGEAPVVLLQSIAELLRKQSAATLAA